VRNSPVTLTIGLLRALAGGGPLRDLWLPWVLWMVGLAAVFIALGARAFARVGGR
jgi:hypothetical protein